MGDAIISFEASYTWKRPRIVYHEAIKRMGGERRSSTMIALMRGIFKTHSLLG